MRLTALNLTNYGPFRAQRIGFDATPGRLNLLIAPNGAGKSVLRGAFCDLLFGIHPQSEMGFRYGYGGMKLLADCVAPDGAAFAFGRRKGMGNTLLGANGGALEPAAFARLLGHTDRALLERLFALDTERLREGGAELLASGGALADALLSAAGGLRQARHLRAALDTARDALAPERKSQKPFYQALDRFTDARRRFEASVLKPETRERQQTELAHQEAELALRQKRAQAASARIAQLERVRRVVGPLRQHDEAAAWLGEHPDAPVLADDCAERLAKAMEALHRADLLVARERQALLDARARAEATTIDSALLDAADAIDTLVKRSGAAAQAAHDIPIREAELAEAERDIADCLFQLGVELPLERAAEAIPRQALITEARRLFNEHSLLRRDLERLPGERDTAARLFAATEKELASLPPPMDMADAAREMRDARHAGDPAALARAAARMVAERQAALDTALARIPAWRARFANLPVQPPATYERLDSARARADAALAAAAAALAALRQEAVAEQTRLAELAAAGALPDTRAIEAARARRDAGWRLIYRRAFTTAPPSAEEDAAWAGAIPLPLAYERAVGVADTLADQRNHESERVAKFAEISRRLDWLRATTTRAEQEHANAQAVHAEALTAWRSALAPLGLAEVTGLADLRDLLTGRDKALEAQRDLDAARAAQAALREQHAAAASRLARALGVAPDHGDLAGLMTLADERIEASRAVEGRRARLRDKLETQRIDWDEKRAALDRARENFAVAREEWSALRTALRRPADEPPATTVALLEQFARLHAATQKAGTARQRLREMRAEVAVQSSDAASLAARVAPDLERTDHVATVEALRRRLAQQLGQAKQRDELLAQVERARKTLAAEQKQQSQCAIVLNTVLAAIGADSVATAGPILTLAAARADAADTQRRTAEQLAGMGDGRALDALRQEVARFETDTIPGEIATAEAERDQAWREAQALSARIATDTAAMAAQAAELESVRAEHDRQAAVATLSRVLDEALVLHVAGTILEDALGAVDAAGTSALLTRIGGLFRTLTDGAYSRVIADDGGNGGVQLRAVARDHPDDPVSVSGLSDGTRDQLFLALRLAAIEDHVATAPPLPFVADDILQTFDDARALAAMRALVDLSRHVQVIVLSHHAHLLALAATLGPAAVHVCDLAAA